MDRDYIYRTHSGRGESSLLLSFYEKETYPLKHFAKVVQICSNRRSITALLETTNSKSYTQSILLSMRKILTCR